jgi:predicted transcriptional regulator with HTH domain
MDLKRLRIQEKIENTFFEIYPCETYDDVVVRIIQEYEKNIRE